MKIVWLVLVIAASSASAGPTVKDQEKMRKFAHDYAACVVRKHHDKASEAILATPSNSAIIKNYSEILDSDCVVAAGGVGIDAHFPKDTYRYALADALVNADFAGHGIESFADRLPLAQPVMVSDQQRAETLGRIKGSRQRDAADKDITGQNALAWLLRYGECIVRHDPEGTRYWLLTRPDTPEETSRIVALQPTFGGCLGDGRLRLNRVMMRGTVAVNYYRLAMATVVPVAKGNP